VTFERRRCVVGGIDAETRYFEGMYPGPGEPLADLRRAGGIDALARDLLDTATAARPRIIAVDGRGGSGKSTLADRLRDAIPRAQVVHTDDIAWWHSRFGWDDLMIDGVLAPLHAGRDVRYQPPAWAPRGRTGWVEVPSAAPAVIVEGCGASRRELAHLIDAAVWVQFDFDEAKRRALPRDMILHGFDEAEAVRNWDEWQTEEIPFFLADRPWERADRIVSYDAEGALLIATTRA
jgi:hypothetical protein